MIRLVVSECFAPDAMFCHEHAQGKKNLDNLADCADNNMVSLDQFWWAFDAMRCNDGAQKSKAKKRTPNLFPKTWEFPLDLTLSDG